MNEMTRAIACTNDVQFDAFADFVLNPELKVPEETLHFMSTLLIDTLGVGVGAADLKVGRIARDFAADFHGAGSAENAATMMFDGRTVSIPGAAWALATQIDNLDGHDGYAPSKGHIGVAVVPALVALAEHMPDLTGRDALTALVVSYEVSARAGMSLHASVSDYHTSGAWNAIGTAAMACRLAGASKETLRQAIGIAEYHGPRSQMMREIDNPTMLHDGSGMGALVGCSSAIMAQRGFTGAPAITIEAPDVAHYWADLGEAWTVDVNYIKPYPICRWAHAAIDATRMLVIEHGITADMVEKINVRTFAESSRLYMGVPTTTSQAQYSLAFSIATYLVHGRIGAEHVSGDGLNDPAVQAIIPKIEAFEDERHNARFPDGRWSDIDVILKDGRTLSSDDVPARGGHEAPMDDKEVREKFDNMASALSADRRDAIWAMRDVLVQNGASFSDLTHKLYKAI